MLGDRRFQLLLLRLQARHLPLRLGDPVADRVEAPKQVVDAGFLQLEPRGEQLDPGAGAGHLLQCGPQALHFCQ